MTTEDVHKNLLMLPWVRPVKGDVPCEGIKWGQMALKDVPRWRDLPPDHRARCKRKAKYIFKATKRRRVWDAPATSGSYCKTHLSMQVSDHMAELRRANKWWNKNGWWRNGVLQKGAQND